MLCREDLGEKMIKIHWDGYKEYKAERNSKDDNFITLINFMKSYYNMSSSQELFDSMENDALAKMMLEKRDIKSPSELEVFLFKV